MAPSEPAAPGLSAGALARLSARPGSSTGHSTRRQVADYMPPRPASACASSSMGGGSVESQCSCWAARRLGSSQAGSGAATARQSTRPFRSLAPTDAFVKACGGAAGHDEAASRAAMSVRSSGSRSAACREPHQAEVQGAPALAGPETMLDAYQIGAVEGARAWGKELHSSNQVCLLMSGYGPPPAAAAAPSEAAAAAARASSLIGPAPRGQTGPPNSQPHPPKQARGRPNPRRTTTRRSGTSGRSTSSRASRHPGR